MTNYYVIMNMSYRFAQERGRGFEWVSEYPDATEWKTIRSAKEAMKQLARRGPCANIFSLIENYGLADQRTVQRYDGLQDKLYTVNYVKET